ncbi:unnamed protein product [Amoebophrya sp. A25]|nr:unnamed protein product [Amoebophrya sp. A25]|eukprot:GSA25T00006116001.1
MKQTIRPPAQFFRDLSEKEKDTFNAGRLEVLMRNDAKMKENRRQHAEKVFAARTALNAAAQNAGGKPSDHVEVKSSPGGSSAGSSEHQQVDDVVELAHLTAEEREFGEISHSLYRLEGRRLQRSHRTSTQYSPSPLLSQRIADRWWHNLQLGNPNEENFSTQSTHYFILLNMLKRKFLDGATRLTLALIEPASVVYPRPSRRSNAGAKDVNKRSKDQGRTVVVE